MILRLALMSSLLVPSITFAAAKPAKGRAGSERPKIAVLDLEAKGVDKATAETVTDIVTVALKKLGVFDVISRADIQQMLNFEESKQLVGCSSSSNCIAEIGGALGVAKVVTGSVGKLGSSYVLNLSLLDTKSAKVIERESRDAKSQEDLVGAAENGSRFLVRSLLEGKQGDVIIKVSETSAEVEIDGKLIGLTPVSRLQMASGPHTVRVSKKGFIVAAKDIVVDEREPTVLDLTLLPSMETINNYDRLANGLRIGAYVATGVGIAALATGIILFWAVFDPQYNKYHADYVDLSANPQNRVMDPSAGQKADPKSQAGMDARYSQLNTMYPLSIALGVAGGVIAAAGIGMFIFGPKPGVYDQYKTVSVGGAKVSFDVSPTLNGGFGSAKLTW